MPARETFLVFALGLLASGATIKPIAAATVSASINVSATVQASCLVSTTGTAFRTSAAAADAAAAVSVACSNSVPYNVSLESGVARSATTAIRAGSGPRFSLLNFAPEAPSRAASPMIVVVTY